MIQMSQSVEDYLKAIYDLERLGDAVQTGALAEALTVAPASVSGMVQRLVGAGLIERGAYRGVRLTETGREAAVRVIRRHRILEAYLNQALGWEWDTVHEEAERLEHAASDQLIERMAEALDNPRYDPHGAPIPTVEGKVEHQELVPMSEVAVGGVGEVRLVSDDDPSRLRYIASLGFQGWCTVRGVGCEAFRRAGHRTPPRAGCGTAGDRVRIGTVAIVSGIAAGGSDMSDRMMSRRALLTGGVVGAVGLVVRGQVLDATKEGLPVPNSHDPSLAAMNGRVIDSSIDPLAFLEHFDYGVESKLPDGRTLREYELTVVDREIEVAPGVMYAAWTFNGQVPGPTIRATEGDVMRVRFSNAGSHPHTAHFHGIHAANMDGVFEVVEPGESYTYEFTAAPAGLHLYHCHAFPLKRHLAKGLYGTFIVDPTYPAASSSRNGHGHERLRYELRWLERDLRRQHRAVRLPLQPDSGAEG